MGSEMCIRDSAKASDLLRDDGAWVLTGTGERRLAKPASPPLLPLLICPHVMAICMSGQLSVKPLLWLSFKLRVQAECTDPTWRGP